jgi:formylglycine-generating enzyme required for sulfatase activity
MGSNPSRFKGDQRPVERVTWDDCQTFISRLNAKTGKNFRLPTEAEWEYAARGGKFSKGYKYAGSNDVSEVAWYTAGPGAGLHPVALKMANELGLYDMSGNAAEWCQDWFVPYYSEPEINPIGPESGQFNVYRGGSWTQPANECRVASRFSLDPHKSNEGLGLRIVMNP